ncbi:MAG TPA: spore germination protein [Syntrophomonadaceae bacterium]|nr:spore germination protein [Syntrophomonadaceae bacterium]
MRFIKSRKPLVDSTSARELAQENLSAQLQDNIDILSKFLERCSDAVIKEFAFGTPSVKAALYFFDGLADRKEIELNILKSLMLELPPELSEQSGEPEFLKIVMHRLLPGADVKAISTFDELVHHISSGDTVLLIDGSRGGLAVSTRSWETRSIDTPENETTIFGPKEGFNETLRMNTALLRRRLKSTNFKIEGLVLGKITKTDVVLCYMDHIAPPKLVKEVQERLAKIDIDGILDTGYIAELVTDEKHSIFTQTLHTEKPDSVCGHLLEGRIAILVDGSPMALILPISFPQYMISPEDYYTNYVAASLFRILRYLAFFIALLLPSLYVAIITYHQEMLPTSLILTIAATRQGVPFPAFVEALILETTFELLREAGLRLPRSVGPAVSIVGALIIGDAAVRAGLVSTPMVVVVAATGIASFVMPSYNAGIITRIARFGFLIAAGFLGFLGIMVALVLMLVRMASLSSFGQPYLTPVAPFDSTQITDLLVRRPWFAMTKRPFLEGMENQVRQKSHQDGEAKE